MEYNKKICEILEQGKRCKANMVCMGPTGAIGPTGPTGPNFNASFQGNVTTSQTAIPQTPILIDNTPVSNNITYNSGTITIQESRLYYIDFNTTVTTTSGQLIEFEINKTTPTEENILSVSSGTYVNSGSTVTLNKSRLFYATAGDTLSIINSGNEIVTINSTGQNTLDITIFKVAQI